MCFITKYTLIHTVDSFGLNCGLNRVATYIWSYDEYLKNEKLLTKKCRRNLYVFKYDKW